MPHPERDDRLPDYRALIARYHQAWHRSRREQTLNALRVLRAGEDVLARELFKPGKFELGRTVATPGSLRAMQEAGHVPPEFLLRHKHGDWGDLDPEDVQENEWSLRNGARLFSRSHTRANVPLYVITEWDRSATTLLLPEDY